MRVASAGHAVFAVVMIAIGVMGLMHGTFAPIWEGVPKVLPGREILAYVCAVVALVCGVGVLLRRTAGVASRILFGYLALWLLVFRGSRFFVAFTAQDTWSGFAETASIVAGAWVLYAWFADAKHNARFARILYGLALIPFGIAHFNYPKETASLVPHWLPMHLAWAYVTGSTFILAGIAVLIGIGARWGAALSALQVGLFTLLIWLPIVIAGANAFQWSEFVISCAVTSGAWVVADSYR